MAQGSVSHQRPTRRARRQPASPDLMTAGRGSMVGTKRATALPGSQPPLRRRTRVVAATVVVVLSGAVGACTAPEETGAENVWPMTGPDASVGGVDVSAEGGARWTDAGLQLSGDVYASTWTVSPIVTDASFSVSAWARPTGRPGEYAAVLSEAGDVAGSFFLGIAEGFWSFSVKPEDGNGSGFVTNRDRATRVDVEPDVWVHLAGVYDSDAGRARFFLNGYPVSEQGIATDAVYAAEGPLLFGRAQADRRASDFFTGTVADVRTWPRALSPGEVAAAARADTPAGATLHPPEESAAFVCPDPHGGVCLGTLMAGTYSTTSFEPALSYTVPAGWTNGQDLPGNLLLSRSVDPAGGIWGGSYIGVYQDIRAPALCGEEVQPGIGTSAAELAAWYRSVPGLQITRDVPVTVGGLSGVALDLRVGADWRSPCPLMRVAHVIPVLIGGGVSTLHHVIGAPVEMRLYLLDQGGGNVAIEVTAVLEQHSLTDYLREADVVVGSFEFES
ncbi:hypothetical protein CVO76_08425 [Arthrobacter agilis]|uniref:LamG-like jellyroll fold domain-containing protein n=1 Tax=Arthrobacter agilis TaxID=37921 RepID=A0A2L0UEG7_9MICC|nr:hypothetical protein CVO76_08425 [Arthrobacter agilis]